MLPAAFILPLLFAVFGAVGIAGGVCLIVWARVVASPVVNSLGQWTVSAVRAIGILVTIISPIFLALGIVNVVSFASGG